MNNEHTEEATMRGKKFLKLCMLVCYCIWCCLEVYIMWSGMQLNGNTVSGNIMIYRQNLYYCRTILEWAVVCIFFLIILIYCVKQSRFVKKSMKCQEVY